MTSNGLAWQNTHPALLCSEPVVLGLATRPLVTNNGRIGPAHLSPCGPLDSGLRGAQPRDITHADCSVAQGHLNSP